MKNNAPGVADLVRSGFQVMVSSACDQSSDIETYSLVLIPQTQFMADNKSNYRVIYKGKGPAKETTHFFVNKHSLVINALEPGVDYEFVVVESSGKVSQFKGFASFLCVASKKTNVVESSEMAQSIANIQRFSPARLKQRNKSIESEELPQTVLTVLDIVLQEFDTSVIDRGNETYFDVFDFVDTPGTRINVVEQNGAATYEIINLFGMGIVTVRDYYVAASVIFEDNPIAIGHTYLNEVIYGQILEVEEFHLESGTSVTYVYGIGPHTAPNVTGFVYSDIDTFTNDMLIATFTTERLVWDFDLNPPRYFEVGQRHDGLPSVDPVSIVPDTVELGENDRVVGTFSTFNVVNTIGLDVEIPNNDLTNFGSLFASDPEPVQAPTSESESSWFFDGLNNLASYFAPNNNGPVDFTSGSGGAPAAPKPTQIRVEKLSDTAVKIYLSRTNPSTDDENNIRWEGSNHLNVNLHVNGQHYKTYSRPQGSQQSPSMWIVDGFKFGNNGWQGVNRSFRSGYVILSGLTRNKFYTFEAYRGARSGPSQGQDSASSSVMSNKITLFIPPNPEPQKPVLFSPNTGLNSTTVYRYDRLNFKFVDGVFCKTQQNGIVPKGAGYVNELGEPLENVDGYAEGEKSDIKAEVVKRVRFFYHNGKPGCSEAYTPPTSNTITNDRVPTVSIPVGLTVNSVYRHDGFYLKYTGGSVCETDLYGFDPSLLIDLSPSPFLKITESESREKLVKALQPYMGGFYERFKAGQARCP